MDTKKTELLAVAALHACIDLDAVVDNYDFLKDQGVEISALATSRKLQELCECASKLANILSDICSDAIDNGLILCEDEPSEDDEA